MPRNPLLLSRAHPLLVWLKVLMSSLAFCLFLVLISLSRRFTDANDVNTAVVTITASIATLTRTPLSSLTAAGAVLAAMAALASDAAVPAGNSSVAALGRYNFIVGGLRVSQSRWLMAPCAFLAPLRALGNASGAGQCIGSAAEAAASDPFTPPVSSFNAINAPAYLAEAFSYRPSPAGGPPAPAACPDLPYWVVLPLASAAADMNSLLALNWLDYRTASVNMLAVLANGNMGGAWTWVSLTITTAPGGAVVGTLASASLFSSAPTASVAGVSVTLQVLTAFFAAELALVLGHAVAAAVHARRPGERRCWPSIALVMRALRAAGAVLPPATMLVDAAALAALAVYWSQTSAAQAALTTLEATANAALWSATSLQGDTTAVQAVIRSALYVSLQADGAAVAVIALLMLKVVVAASATHRLGVLSQALSDGLPDLLTAAFFVAVVMATFGAIGQLMYGVLVTPWASAYSAGLMLFLELNGDGPTNGQIEASPLGTPVFYGAFYVLVQSALVVLLFAILTDSYGDARQAQRAGDRAAAAAAAAGPSAADAGPAGKELPQTPTFSALLQPVMPTLAEARVTDATAAVALAAPAATFDSTVTL